MERWKENLLGWGIGILAVSFIFVLAYTLFPQDQVNKSINYQSCNIDTGVTDSTLYVSNTGYLLDGKCVSYEEFDQARRETEGKRNNQIFVTSLILSVITLAAGISIRHVPIVGVALTWAGAAATFVSLAGGFNSFSPWIRTSTLAMGLVGLMLLAYKKLPDSPGDTTNQQHASSNLPLT